MAPRSAGVASAIVRMPSRRAVRMTRQAISPRLAIRTLANMAAPSRREVTADGGGIARGDAYGETRPARLP